MVPLFFTILAPQNTALANLQPQPPDPIVLMRDAFLSALQQFGVGRKFAQAEMHFKTRQHFDDALNLRTFTVYRLSLLPDEIKRVLWQGLKQFFGYEASEADNPELERRIGELEAENRELQRRFDELEALVKRVLPKETP